MNKPNCYECIYRRNIPGDAHSSCEHPSINENGGVVVAFILALTCGGLLSITFDDYGIKNGWAEWPINFDPTWLKNCDGFTKKKL